MEDSKQQWLTIAAIVLVIGGLGYFLFRQGQEVEEGPVVESEDIVAEERANELLQQLNVELPEDVDRVNLREVGESGAAGVVTRSREEGEREIRVLAALPEPVSGEFYAAYLSSPNEELEDIYLGRLREAKGGFILETLTEASAQEYPNVKVTREKVDDEQVEEVLLEGAFMTTEAEAEE